MRKSALTLLALCGAASLHAAAKSAPRDMVVIVPVADVRAEPKRRAFDNSHDDLQETQVLKGETVWVTEKKGKWVRIECPAQAEYTHHAKWEGYPGWIERKYLSSDLSLAEKLTPVSNDSAVLRKNILFEAARHIGSSYLWGGRSLYDSTYKETSTGVDCSGLVSWAFYRSGILVPRDSHEQFMKARRIEPAAMKPGDLIFLAATDKPEKVVHVMIYAGGEDVIEAPQTGETVRRIALKDRVGVPFASLKNGGTFGDRIVYCGTFFFEEGK